MTTFDENHIKYCVTDREKLILKEYLKTPSQRKVAKALSYGKGTIQRALKAIQDRASLQGYAPDNDMEHTAPDTHFVKGTSTLYKDGKPALQWVKTDRKAEDQYKVMREIVEALKEDIKPCDAAPMAKNKAHKESLINVYTITDLHYGMLAWGEETGADWDLDIAGDTLVDWFASAIDQSPNSASAILANIGDLFHWDGMEAKTPTHGHILDADTRFQKLVRTAINTLRKVVEMMLEKHKYVHIIHATGNHDLASSVWLRELFALYYSNDPRVTVEQSPDVYYAYEFGQTSLFWHHGHKRGVGNVSAVFAAKFREIFGRTKYSYAHLGHRHSVDVKENSLMIVEQHQTLAAPDAHASEGGWVSLRSAQCITYHKDYGEVSRVRITPEMLK